MVNARQAKTAREKAAEMRAEAARREARSRAIAIAAAVVCAIVVVIGAGIVIKIAKHDQDAKAQAAAAPPANLTNNSFLVDRTTSRSASASASTPASASASTPASASASTSTSTSAAKSPVTIQVYEDFMCPACTNFEHLNAEQLDTWTADGTVRLEYHLISILDRYSSTEYSTRSLNAAAVVINVKPSAFLAFHDLLIANQPPENSAGLSDDQLLDYAVQAGVERSQVESDIRNLKYKNWIQRVSEDFSKKGYTGTPTVVVNGKQLDDYSPEKIKAAVEAAAKG